MPIEIPAGSLILDDADGSYVLLPDGTKKRFTMVATVGSPPTIVATRIRKDGTVEIETQKASNGDK